MAAFDREPDADAERSNIEKVAILLASLESSLAVNLLQKFEADDVRRIVDSSNTLGALRTTDVEPLVEEFTNEFSSALGISAGPQQLMALLESAFSADEVGRLLGRAPPANPDSVWPKFSNGHEATLVPYLLDEHEQTTAYVLSRLPAELASRCLAMLPRGTRSRVTLRLLKIAAVHSPVNAVLELALLEDMFSTQTSKSDTSNFDRVATVLNRLDRNKSEELLEDLGQSDPDGLKTLRKMIFMFEDVGLLNEKHRLKLFDRVSTEAVIQSLFGTEPELREIVLSSMGARARRMVEGELQGDLSNSRQGTPAARRSIADLALQMARKGEIELPDRDGPVNALSAPDGQIEAT